MDEKELGSSARLVGKDLKVTEVLQKQLAGLRLKETSPDDDSIARRHSMLKDCCGCDTTSVDRTGAGYEVVQTMDIAIRARTTSLWKKKAQNIEINEKRADVPDGQSEEKRRDVATRRMERTETSLTHGE